MSGASGIAGPRGGARHRGGRDRPGDGLPARRHIRGNTERRDAQLAVITHNIRAAAEAGVPCLKYALPMIGIPRTGRTPDAAARCTPISTLLKRPTRRWPSIHRAVAAAHRAAAVGPVSPQESWDAFAYSSNRSSRSRRRCGVALAFHPQDPPLPRDTGLRGFHHVLGSVEGLKRYLDLTPSKYHVMNFCQGTVAEMCTEPADARYRRRSAISAGGARSSWSTSVTSRAATSHFDEVYPDNGDVNMYQALRVYKEVGYCGMICPDHVPDLDGGPGEGAAVRLLPRLHPGAHQVVAAET